MTIYSLRRLKSRTNNEEVNWMIDVRLNILDRFQAETLVFLLDCKKDIPYTPSNRCNASVFWFSSSKITETTGSEEIKRKLVIGDSMMRTECIYILANKDLPEALKKIFTAHFKRLEKLHVAFGVKKSMKEV